jgi:hypothetical protein
MKPYLSHPVHHTHSCLSFLRKFKKTCALRSFKHPEFWKLVQAVGMPLSLIHEGEAASDVREQESRKVRNIADRTFGALTVLLIQFIER